MTKKQILFFSLVLLLLVSCQFFSKSIPEILNGRLLFLGDSITQDGGYVSIIEYELFKNYPKAKIDLISIGLSSETVSGLTEPVHPYPRPNLHERLERALEKLKPQTVVACYGMNDGIYYPQSAERFQAYKDGIKKLVAAVKNANAQIIILTPPIFESYAIPQKVVELNAELFGYATPYVGYNDVLSDYSNWLMSIQEKNVRVINLNKPMFEYVQQMWKTEPNFTLTHDGVHPQLIGHALMAQLFLDGTGVPLAELDPQEYAEQLKTSALYKLVHQRRQMRSIAWLLDVGFNKPGNYEGLPVDEAEIKAGEMAEQIRQIVLEKKE